MKASVAAAGLLLAGASLLPAPILLAPIVFAAATADSTHPAPACGRTTSATSDGCPAANLASVIAFARAQLGKPYVFGATGPDAYDCSGLVQSAYHTIGINLPRLAEDQALTGSPVPIASTSVQPGDLIVTWGGDPPHDHGHIAIAISPTEEIQAPKTGDVVKITPIAYARVQTIRRIASDEPAATAGAPR